MARSYARIITAIWRNAEFRALEPTSQWLYILLVTQPDISAAGTLPLTVRRWASLAEGCTTDQVESALEVLERRRFVAVDPLTEEVLVRSFVRWDGGYGNRKRLPVIKRAALELASPGLRTVLQYELDRLGVTVEGLAAMVDGLPDALPDSPSTMTAGGEGVLTSSTSDVVPFPQMDRLSDSPSDSACDTPSLFEGVVGGYVSSSMPQPTTLNHPPSVGAENAPPRATVGARARNLAMAYKAVVKLCKFEAVMGVAKQAINAGYDDERIRGALLALADEGRSVTIDSMRYALEGFPARRPAPSTTNRTDADIAAFLGAPTGGATVLHLHAGGQQ